MALTKGFKITCVILVAGAMVAGYAYWKTHHVPAPQPVDVGVEQSAPVQQPQEAPPVQQAAQQPEPAPQPVQQQEQPQQTDASANRGMQFLLNQGKKQ